MKTFKKIRQVLKFLQNRRVLTNHISFYLETVCTGTYSKDKRFVFFQIYFLCLFSINITFQCQLDLPQELLRNCPYASLAPWNHLTCFTNFGILSSTGTLFLGTHFRYPFFFFKWVPVIWTKLYQFLKWVPKKKWVPVLERVCCNLQQLKKLFKILLCKPWRFYQINTVIVQTIFRAHTVLHF